MENYIKILSNLSRVVKILGALVFIGFVGVLLEFSDIEKAHVTRIPKNQTKNHTKDTSFTFEVTSIADDTAFNLSDVTVGSKGKARIKESSNPYNYASDSLRRFVYSYAPLNDSLSSVARLIRTELRAVDSISRRTIYDFKVAIETLNLVALELSFVNDSLTSQNKKLLRFIDSLSLTYSMRLDSIRKTYFRSKSNEDWIDFFNK